ncbi:Signal transduction histidine kinase [Reichenbachiella faecimaris]|uniref:histidine kinase n=1 Tax=Reichenbachiella faecimaris TaxID=692418 RepID=A0A1W2G8N2_REIFA|nr:ATP-binding protein [Reichenbachiella faecimaris]SMD32961.1 Signal transduction histidine kinase [Reichenbachiella faecimaris]
MAILKKTICYVWIVLIALVCDTATLASNLTWKQAQEQKAGIVAIQYKLNEPFLMSTHGELEGLEYEMMAGFQRYLANQYGVHIQYHWIEWNTLSEIFNQIQTKEHAGDIGLDIISWTADRERNVKFSDPYFPDFQVLVTHRSNPSILHEDEFNDPYNAYTAISVLGTTYDQNLKKIRKQGSHFDIRYIEQSTQIIEEIVSAPKSFGYSDLTRYLLALNNDSPIKRLNAYAVRGHGLGVIFNKDSDWDMPFNEYLKSDEFNKIKQNSIRRYLGSEFIDFMKNLSNHQNEEMVLLMQEKMFMDEEIQRSKIEAEQQEKIKVILIIAISFTFLTAFFLFNRSKIKSNANKLLLSHQKLIEQKNELLSERNQELIDINNEKNSYIHILSHDLRAPINNINSISKLLKDAQLSPDEVKMLDHITNESKRLSDMVTRILDVERIESQQLEEFKEVNLSECLQEIATNFSQAATDKQITIHTEIVPNMYISGIDAYVFHIFDNLMSNAIKFTPHKKNIHFSTSSNEHQVVVKLRDEGPGLSEEDQGNMFKKFQTLSAKPTDGEASNGIGLSIVHKYVNILNAKLACESELNMGTTFIVTFDKVSD